MNGIETRFSKFLDQIQRQGEIVRWGYEEVTFKLAPATSYTPDFLIILPNRHWVLVETKGFLRDDAAIKFKIAAEKYPEHSWLMLKEEKRTKQFFPIYSFPNKIYFPESTKSWKTTLKEQTRS